MKCKICGKELASDDRGRYYAGICRECCAERNLCPDCGGPIEVDDLNFACTGYHYLKGSRSLEVITPVVAPVSLKRKVRCPECGHLFEV